MGHPVKRLELEPLPQAKVVYSPKAQVLLIESGQSSTVGEEMAQSVLILYGNDVTQNQHQQWQFASTTPKLCSSPS